MQERNDTEHLPLTGERYIPGMEGNMRLEHLHRYAVAIEYVKDKVVLDIACGEGYGAAMLSSVAQKVFGVDISSEAINHARHKYQSEKIEFRIGSCSKIPLSDHSVDAVVSFETIEHHDQHDAMMAEVKRVLKPGGILVISSPDKYNYSDVPGYNNPFHVKELYCDEFKSLLNAYFQNVSIFGQRIIYGSGIFAEDHNGLMFTYDMKEMSIYDSQKARFRGMARPCYDIAIASDSTLPEAVEGVLEQAVCESEGCRSTVSEKDVAISQKEQAIDRLKESIGQNTKELSDSNTEIVEKEQQVTDLEDELGRREQALSDAKDVIVEKDQTIEGLKDVNSQKETVIAEKEKTLEKANTDIANLQATVVEKDRALADANTAIAENESAITALEGIISQNRKELGVANAGITEKERQVTDLEDELGRKEQALSDVKDVIAEKDRMIGDLNDANTQKETVIAEKDQVLEKANIDIANLQVTTAERGLAITDKDRQIHSHREELYSVYTSKSWRYTFAMRKVGTVARRIVSILHRPWLRTKIKQVYFLLPPFLRNSRLIDTLKNRFKNKEIL